MKKQLYIVDGYNMIGSWQELVALKKSDDIEAARDLLLQMCSNFQKFEDIEIWVVFDAQFVPGIQQTFHQYRVKVIFTKEDETADSYIERTVAKQNVHLVQVSVATSDLAQQWLVFQKGALRKSAQEFYQEIKQSYKKQQDFAKAYEQVSRRRSPWNEHQLHQLHHFRIYLDNSNSSNAQKGSIGKD